jgi:NAD(P)H-dependent flavin oxidoreductase YrpB (nitropropane dioxygenase family)
VGLLGIEHPILLAPMGSVAGRRLAAAVTHAGRAGPAAVQFVPDSPLEGDGFELSVPRERGHRFELSLLFMSPKPSAF